MVKISVITVVKNEPIGLEKTIESIRAVKLTSAIEIEYIVIDGLSRRETIEVIERGSDVIDRFVSELDRGLYDAMNKSSSFATAGSFLIWINAGDIFLCPDELTNMLNDDSTEVIFSAVRYPNGEIVKPDIRLPFNAKNIFPNSTFRHQGFFIRKESFDKLGGYSLSIGMQADGELMSRASSELQWAMNEHAAAIFDLTGMSSQRPDKALSSYLKIWKSFGFSNRDLIRYHWWYLLKLLIRISLPVKIQMWILRIKRGKLVS